MTFSVSRAACALAAAALLALCVTASADPLIVKTADGKVHGKTINDGKVRAWLGIPYAAPPVGDLRWKSPEPAVKWKDERDATKFGAHCAQNAVFADMIFQDSGGSEDCLFLNVYAPATADENSKLPVMYWIHGGGYSGGSGDEPRHNGDFLPLKGVVLVTINYRLGVFGFLATSDLAKEQGGSAGNYGLMDMVAGLQWVHDNIKNFGGDPKNVTIFGESAGSFAVSTLMAAPSAQPLFARGIGESGGAIGSGPLDMSTLDKRTVRDDKFVAGLNVHSLAELRALPTQAILDAAKKPGAGFSPDVDGKFLTESVTEIYKEGKQAHVPLLAGWNADEGSFFAMRGMTAVHWKENASKLFPDPQKAAEFLKLYPGDTDAQALRSAIDFGSDQFIAMGTWRWLEAQRTTGGGAPVYRYHFEWPATPSKFHPGTFAFHSDDIEYVFGTLDTRPGFKVTPQDRAMSEEMMSYWTNFAKNGDPNGGDLPYWPKYNDEGYPLMHLNVPSGPDLLRDRYLFLEDNMPPMRF
jgi:para-nitrobenzyl esterase